jgi:hypothetical protein
MDVACLCRWLKLPSDQWPPDHYTLLGLPRGAADMVQIETQAHDRMKLVRCYQISHPELATEAMNRLAEAFACLSDASAKQSYDAELGIVAPPASSAEASGRDATRLADDTVTEGLPMVMVWNGAAPPVRIADPATQPPPVRAAEPALPPPAPAATAATATGVTAPALADSGEQLPNGAPAEPIDPVVAAAKKSWRPLKGMLGRSALNQRLHLTRALTRAWLRLARYLSSEKRPLRVNEQRDFLRSLARIDYLRDELPMLVGEPGHPGYRVAILARDEKPAQAFRDMGEDERQLLAQDWKTTSTILHAHIEFLEKELRRLHQENILVRWTRPVRGFLYERAGWVLAFLVSVAAAVGLWAWLHP